MELKVDKIMEVLKSIVEIPLDKLLVITILMALVVILITILCLT
jgi:hypothetical protein